MNWTALDDISLPEVSTDETTVKMFTALNGYGSFYEDFNLPRFQNHRCLREIYHACRENDAKALRRLIYDWCMDEMLIEMSKSALITIAKETYQEWDNYPEYLKTMLWLLNRMQLALSETSQTEV